MTMPPPPPAVIEQQGRPPRPAVVSIAGYLLFVLAGLQLLSLIVSLQTFGAMRDVLPDIYRDTPMEGKEDTIITLGIVFGVGVVVLFVAGFIVLGLLDLRGKQPARIVTWVFLGLLLCCNVIGLAGSGVSSLGQNSGTSGIDAEEMQRRLNDATPSWVHPASLALTALQALIAICVIVLLLLPAAHPFFRKQPVADQWTPPYPTYPTA